MKLLALKPVVRKPILLSLTITFSTILLSSIYFVIAQPILPIFYSLALPEQHLAPKLWLFILPLISLFMSLLHIVIMHIFKEYDDLILRLFGTSTVIMQFMLLLAIVRIMYVTI